MLPIDGRVPVQAGEGLAGHGGVDGERSSVGRREVLMAGAGGAGLAALALAPDAASASRGRRHGHLSDWEQIYNLWSRYSYSIDSGDLVAFAAQYRFGTWNGMDEAATLALLRNIVILYPENLTYAQGGRGEPLIGHLSTNVAIDVARDGKTASSVSYRTGVQGVLGVPGVPDFPLQPIFINRYDDTYQKIRGRWWFKATVLTRLVAGDTSHHVRR
jgi:hypothetical protein